MAYFLAISGNLATSIHTQPIPAVQKMTYLFTSLKDKALNSVEGYAITSENYPNVIDVRKNCYGNTKALTETLEAELMNLPKANESTTSLRQTFESIERICRQLKQLNFVEESTLIATAIKSKLPYTYLLTLLRQKNLLQLPIFVMVFKNSWQFEKKFIVATNQIDLKNHSNNILVKPVSTPQLNLNSRVNTSSPDLSQ